MGNQPSSDAHENCRAHDLADLAQIDASMSIIKQAIQDMVAHGLNHSMPVIGLVVDVKAHIDIAEQEVHKIRLHLGLAR